MKHYIAAIFTAFLLIASGMALAQEPTEDMAPSDMLTVNVNAADAETIADVLVGVGLRRAEAIVRYREEHGKFHTAEELTAVRGIGKSTVEKNLERISLK